jgi:transketolase
MTATTVTAPSAAGSGHPTCCTPAAELVAGMFFYAIKFDPKNPNSLDGDCFVLSGYTAPVLHAAG